MSGYDTIVVGSGVVGAAVALAVARRGAGSVLLCDEALLPGHSGATLASGGLVRLHHTASCDVPLAVAGAAVYRDWARRVGPERVFTRTGFAVVVDRSSEAALRRNVAAVVAAGGRSEVISGAALAERHPGLSVPDDVVVAYEPDGGHAEPAAAAASMVAAAVRSGARTHGGVRVLGLDRHGDRVTGLRTTIGALGAERVVVCAGAGSDVLAGEAGLELPLERRRIGVAHVAADLSPGDLPIGIDDTVGTYFRPVEGGMYVGARIDPHSGPDRVVEPLHEKDALAAVDRLSGRVPALRGGEIVGGRTGVDAYTPDGHPMIGAVGPEGLYLCTGFSGGGVKVAPAVGELVATEIVTGTEVDALSPFRPDRFADRRPIESENPYVHM